MSKPSNKTSDKLLNRLFRLTKEFAAAQRGIVVSCAGEDGQIKTIIAGKINDLVYLSFNIDEEIRKNKRASAGLAYNETLDK